MYSPIGQPNISSDNGLSPVQHEAIIWTNDDFIYSIFTSKLQWNLNQDTTILIQENDMFWYQCNQKHG